MSDIHNYITIDVDYYEKDMTDEKANKLINIWKDYGFELDFQSRRPGKTHIQCTKIMDGVNEDALRYEVMEAYDIAMGTKGLAHINPMSISLSAG